MRGIPPPKILKGKPSIYKNIWKGLTGKVATVVNLHSPDLSLGVSAGNMNLKTRTAGQTMVMNARRRLGMKTTPQPEAQVEAKAGSRPARRMRSKGPLQHEDSRPAPRPGGDPPDDPDRQDQLGEGDARGSGGVVTPPRSSSAS